MKQSFILFLILFASFHGSDALGEEKIDSTATLSISRPGILTLEENNFFRADFFPLSLAQRGRLSTTAYRGMPPGFKKYYVAGNPFKNPFSGFWNEQWLPYYAVDSETAILPGASQKLSPLLALSDHPITRIVFSQDYVLNLSFVDINFYQQLNRKNFIYLSGSNFLSDGSLPSDFSKLQVTTYRTQLHWQILNQISLDLFYWQIRHRFNMEPQTGSAFRDKFKQVGHLLWSQIGIQLSENDSLLIFPGIKNIEDRYAFGQDFQRDNRYRILHLTGEYDHRFSKVHLGISGETALLRNKASRFWSDYSEGEGSITGHLELKHPTTHFESQLGVFHHSELGSALTGEFKLAVLKNNRINGGIAGYSTVEAPPILWRTLTHDSIPAYTNSRLMRKEEVALSIHWSPSQHLVFSIEPFVLRMNNYPIYKPLTNSWNTMRLENRGLRLKGSLLGKHLALENDFTYNADYRKVYAPQINNITTLKIAMNLFGEIPVDGIFTWHYLGYFHLIDFHRLLYSYRITELETGPYYLADLRFQIHFKKALLFFIWENLLSQDYSLIQGTGEELLVFRLGVDWLLFD